MAKDLDAATRSKLDAVLSRVVDPQSELSVADLGIVRKLTYSEAERTVLVFLDIAQPRLECPACEAANSLAVEGIVRRLREELGREFPGFSVEFPERREGA